MGDVRPGLGVSRPGYGPVAPMIGPDPRYAVLANEAAAAMRAGDDVAAERAARALVRANPREHAAWHALAVVALRTGRADAAVEFAERAHQLDRKNPGYLSTLGVAYGDLGRAEEAIAALRRALKLRPAFADAHYNLGMVYDRQERLEKAHDAYRRALAIEPGHGGATHNLARVLRRLGRTEDSLAMARVAYAQAPGNVDRAVGLAATLAEARGEAEAREFVGQCIAAYPQESRFHAWLAESFLKHGEWQAGWREYLWRPAAMRERALPLEPLRTGPGASPVRLLPDQGLGDTLFFLRFADELVAQGGIVTLRTPAKLAAVLAAGETLAGLAIESVESGPVAAADGARPMLLGDLPFLLGATGAPPPVRLAARPALVARWRETLAQLGAAPYLGLAWRGGTDRRTESRFGERGDALLFKEVLPGTLAAAVRDAPGTLVSIQRLPGPGEREALAAAAGRPVHDLSAANDDLEQMTALLAVLDECIGVSNTNMHLRAGLGLAAKVLVPFPPEFRWMAEGDGSPWFPGFRVYRQGTDRRWDDALTRLAADLGGT
jgi:tetratricopeptide (TPR) repeat protein